MKRTTAALLVAMVLGLAFGGRSTAQSRIYWIGADDYRGTVHWTNAGGTESGSFEMRPGGILQSLAVDQANGWIYATDLTMGHGYNGDLFRAPLHNPTDQERVLWSYVTTGGLEIDPIERLAYFSRLVIQFSIFRGSLDDGTLEEWLPLDDAWVVAMDLDIKARLLFFTTGRIIGNNGISLTGGTTLMRAHLDKDFAEVVEVDWAGAGIPEPELGQGVALDTTHRKVYLPVGGRIYRTQYMGGVPTLVYEAEDASVSELAFEPVSRTLFWLERRDDPVAGTTGMLMKAQVGGTLPWESAPVTPIEGTRGIAVFADPGAARLEFPAPDAAVETTVELRWDEVLGSPRYDVLVASDPDFSEVVYKENLPGTHVEFVAPVAGRDYYWRVQSNACFIAPHWSETRRLAVGHAGPLAATLTHPPAGAEIEPGDTFAWVAAPHAVTYTLELAQRPDFAPLMIRQTELTATSALVEGLERGETYYWRVAGFDERGRYTYTAPQTFSVAQLLSAVSLVSPDDGSVGIAPYARLEWTPLDGAESYELEVSTSPAFSEVIAAASLAESEYSFETPLPYETTLYWRVRGANQSGPGDWSDVWSFTTAVGTANEALAEVPSETRLMAPYPNPASRMITIPFELAESMPARIEIFDLAGRRVRVIESEHSGPRRLDVRLDLADWLAGAYFVVLNGDRWHATSIVVAH